MGLDSLVEAARFLNTQSQKFRLLIGGAGSLEQELRRQVQEAGLNDTVRLLGRIPESDLPNCFAAADCFVLPTRALECFGLIILEAYASGTPVIGTPVGAIPELVVQQGSEWLTTSTTAAALADRMAAFLQGKLVSDRQSLRSFAEQWKSKIGLDRLVQVILPPAMAEVR
jgi:glycosyltransferase involved in cell wall biosynthesis